VRRVKALTSRVPASKVFAAAMTVAFCMLLSLCPKGFAAPAVGEPVQIDERGAEVFKKWIRHLVSHWGALDTISAFSRSEGGNLENSNISLISIRSSASRSSDISDWKDTVRALAFTVDAAGVACKLFDADAAIKMVETEIESGATDCNIVKAFQSTTSTIQAKVETSQSSPPPFPPPGSAVSSRRVDKRRRHLAGRPAS